MALREVIKSDQVLILGTRASMWDVLVEYLAMEDADEALRLELMDTAKAGTVDQDLLDRTTALVSQALGLPCVMRLISYARDTEEQTSILDTIAQIVPSGRVVIDLTHGFRHLAAIGLQSAFFLQRIQGLTVEALYYGALDMTENNVTPVINLSGMMSVQDWISALDRFDQNGDYSVFQPLLEADGVPADKANCLVEAAFFERTFNLSQARQKLQTFLPVLDQPLTGVSALFQPQLQKRLSWIRSGGLFEYQQRLAHFYLDNKNYVRASLFAFEALITRECRKDANPYLPANREDAKAGMQKTIDAKGHQHRDAYWMLRNLRNAFAHGNPPVTGKIHTIIADLKKLPVQLRQAIKTLDI